MLPKKQPRKNHYRNSRSQKERRLKRFFLGVLKILLLVGGMVGTSLFLIFVYDALTQSSYFKTETITVRGNQRFLKEKILKQAGLKLHDNILSVNLKALRNRLMAHPWIASAEIERELPDTIRIQVKERVPIAIVDMNQLFYMDEDGEIFKSVESSDHVKVPLVTGLALSDIDFNDPWRCRLFRAVMEVLRLCRLHKNVIPFDALQRIHVDREMGLTLYAFFPPSHLSATSDCQPAFAAKGDSREQAGQNEVAINVGFGDYESKCSRLQDMVSYLKKDGFVNPRSIDLNDTDRVVVRHSLPKQAENRFVSGGRQVWPNRRTEV